MSWRLNESNFTFFDKLKICKFFLNSNKFWTMADEVENFERVMKNFVGTKHAVFVSSGSTANTILAMYLKDKVYTKTKNTVVFPSTTWITSVSPFVREGFKPHFIDIQISDLSMNLEELEKYLITNHKKVACVFVTSLLGFSPDIQKLKTLEAIYNVKIMLDNCESTLSGYNNNNISSYFTSTTSTYFGHQLQSVEGGFIFTNNDEEWEYFLMARNHGMVRSLKNNHKKYSNTDVDSRFDFNFLGNNFRNTNINAFIGQLDFKRVKKYTADRRNMYKLFEEITSDAKALKHVFLRKRNYYDVPFSIPLIFALPSIKEQVEQYCKIHDIETRPIISGNLLRQTCFKGIFDPHWFTVSEYIHTRGMYVGLHSKVDTNKLIKLARFVSSLS